MKHLLLAAVTASLSLSASGQSAQWLNKPVYDNMAIAHGANIFLADSAKSTILLGFDGRRLGSAPDSVCSFNEGVAVTVRRSAPDEITGFITSEGAFTSLEGEGLKVAMDDPTFYNGLLLVKRHSGFGFINSNNQPTLRDYPLLYPYHGGVAAGMLFEDPKKQKDPYYMMFDKEGNPVRLFIPGKGPAEPKDVNFISSLSDDGRCIAVIKRKLYEYRPDSATLTPLYSNTDFEHKHQIQVNGEMSKWLMPTDNGFQLTAAVSKDQPVSYIFNRLFQPVEVRFPNMTEKFRINEPKPVTFESRLSGFRENGLEGININGQLLCPPQFDKVDLCVNDVAVVTVKGHKGLVGLTASQPVKLLLNQGDDIGFRHQKFNTTIRIQLPKEARADYFNIDIPSSAGCIIDPTSRRFANTDNGNWVQYDCTLFIPDSLPPTLTTLTYPVTLINDGLRLSDIPLNVNAWHYRYHTVDIDESELVIENGNVLFPVAIHAEKQPGDPDYPVTLSIKTSGQPVEIDKISETLYKCRINNLVEGPNSFDVVLREKGCPAIVHPFMIDYTKGKRTRGRTVKEAAAIQRQNIMKNASDSEIDNPAVIREPQQTEADQNSSQPDSTATQPKPAPTQPAAPAQPSTLDMLKNYKPSEPEKIIIQ